MIEQKKASDRNLVQYRRTRKKAGAEALFNRIHEEYAMFNQTFLKNDKVSKAGSLEALKVLEHFLTDRVGQIQKEREALEEKGNLTLKPEGGEANPNLTKLPGYQTVVETDMDRWKVEIGRELKSLGKTRIEKLGEEYLTKILREDAGFFNKTLKLGEKLDKTKKKIVQIVKSKKDTAQGKSTVTSKPQTFGLYIKFPTRTVHEKLRDKGLIDKFFKPKSMSKLLNADDITIINYYNSVSRGLLNYYSPCHNFWDLRQMVNYTVRYSLLATLGHKHKGSISKAIKKYGKSPSVVLTMKNKGEKILATFISEMEIAKATRKFRTSGNQKDDLKNVFNPKLGVQLLSNPSQLLNSCAIKDCPEKAVEWHHVKKLNRRYKSNIVSTTDVKGNRLSKQRMFESALKRKQIPLCSKHHKMLHLNKIGIEDIIDNYKYKETFSYRDDTEETTQ